MPQLHEFYAAANHHARPELARMFQAADSQPDEQPDDEESARLVGALYRVLLAGVAIQWLLGPEHAPTGDDLTKALRLVAASLQEPQT